MEGFRLNMTTMMMMVVVLLGVCDGDLHHHDLQIELTGRQVRADLR